jgi:prepilin-type N-terminal cleavage/methylation domain-containing protein
MTGSITIRRESEYGFTLIEILVAIFIAGVVALTAHAAVSAASESIARADAHLTLIRRGAAVRAQLQDWLISVRLDGESGDVFAGEGADAEGWTDDRLVFVTMRPDPFHIEPTQVTLAIDRDPSTIESGLVATLVARGDTVERRLELAPEATGFRVRYLFRRDAEENWYRSWYSTVATPTAAELSISGDSLSAMLQLPITIPMEWR